MSLSPSDKCDGIELLAFGAWFKSLGIGVKVVGGPGSLLVGTKQKIKKGMELLYDRPPLLLQNVRICSISSFCCYKLKMKKKIWSVINNCFFLFPFFWAIKIRTFHSVYLELSSLVCCRSSAPSKLFRKKLKGKKKMKNEKTVWQCYWLSTTTLREKGLTVCELSILLRNWDTCIKNIFFLLLPFDLTATIISKQLSKYWMINKNPE